MIREEKTIIRIRNFDQLPKPDYPNKQKIILSAGQLTLREVNPQTQFLEIDTVSEVTNLNLEHQTSIACIINELCLLPSLKVFRLFIDEKLFHLQKSQIIGAVSFLFSLQAFIKIQFYFLGSHYNRLEQIKRRVMNSSFSVQRVLLDFPVTYRDDDEQVDGVLNCQLLSILRMRDPKDCVKIQKWDAWVLAVDLHEEARKNKEDFPLFPFCQISFPLLKKLFLIQCNIISIQPLQKMNAPLLIQIQLQSNYVHSIRTFTKVDFPKLKFLSLQNNKIREISTLFQMNCKQLKKIRFSWSFLDVFTNPGQKDSLLIVSLSGILKYNFDDEMIVIMSKVYSNLLQKQIWNQLSGRNMKLLES